MNTIANKTPSLRIGVDLGGTKISIIAMDSTGKTLAKMRTPTPREDYDATLQAIDDLVSWAKTEADACSPQSAKNCTIGIGIPGSIAPGTGRIQNANSTWLNDRYFEKDLREKLGQNIRMANDANCFVLSEFTDGAAQKYSSAFGVIIGTGCGGGMIWQGQLIEGARRSGGEWGHVPLPWPQEDEIPGPSCWCGASGCLETWISGPALARDYQKASRKEAAHNDHYHSSDLTAVQIAKQAKCGNRHARQALKRHADRLARGLAMIVNIFDPEVIVLGGGLSQMEHLYRDVPGLMAPHIFAHDKSANIIPPHHGDDSGVRGAAFLWP